MSATTLNREQFKTACKGLVKKYDNATRHDKHLLQVLGKWTWAEHAYVPGLGYLMRLSLTHDRQLLDQEVVDVDLVNPLFDEDEATLVTAPASSRRLLVRQYVVYSHTFQVPVFYFSMHDFNGTPSTLNDILQTVLLHSHSLPMTEKTNFALQLPSSNFPLLSQGDHPTLGTPCWYFHPCETASAIFELQREDGFEGSEEEKHLRSLEIWFMILAGVVDFGS